MSEDDKYTYAGSGGVLINSKGIREYASLDAAMNDYASFALAELANEPIPERPGFDYLRDIHMRMFAPIVPGIAGRIRDVNAQATGTGIPYCRPEYIDENLSAVFRKLDREDYLSGVDSREFADRLADRWGELSAVHPFRDGNTRSQSFYVASLAERAGHPIDWQRVDVDELRTLRLHAVAGRERPLADYLSDRLMEPGAVGRSVPVLDPTLQRIVDVNKRNFPTSATETRPPAQRGGMEARGYRPTRDEGRSNDTGYGR